MAKISLSFPNNNCLFRVGEEITVNVEIRDDEIITSKIEFFVFWKTEGKGNCHSKVFYEEVLNAKGQSVPGIFSKTVTFKGPLHPLSFNGQYFSIVWMVQVEMGGFVFKSVEREVFVLVHSIDPGSIFARDRQTEIQTNAIDKLGDTFVYDEDGNVVSS